MRHRTLATGPLALTALAVTLALIGLLPASAIAQTSGLAGNWSGTGRIILTTGDTERARCRASIRQQAGRTFAVSAVCATPSTRIAQSARVQQVSANAYEGQFYNREYDVGGRIWIRLRGDRLTATLTGGGATGTMNLGR